MSLRALAVVTLVLLTGCATRGPELRDTQARLAPNVVFILPSPTALNQTATISQSIVARFKDQSFSFEAQIQISPGTLDLVALDGFGRRGLTVTWTEGGLVAEAAPWLPKFIRPADILADIALVYWPQEALQPALGAAGASLREAQGARVVSAGGRDLVVVDYGAGTGWNRSATLRNLVFGYEIEIQSAEIAP